MSNSLCVCLVLVAIIGVANASTAPSVPSITPSSTTYDCTSSRNTGQSGRMSTKLTCTQLYDWALYLVYNQSACSVTSINTTYEGNCVGSNGTLINSLYIEFVYNSTRVVASNGVPYSTYNSGATSANPNEPCEYYTVMLLPSTATTTSNGPTITTMGQVGTSNTGGLIYNSMSAETYCNAAAIEESDTFDSCNGHADTKGAYHYHLQPPSSCLMNTTSCSIVGYLYDGFPVYSECSGYTACYQLINTTGNWSYSEVNSGKTITVFNGCSTSDYEYSASVSGCNLDKANGITVNGSYRYYMTSTYPFLPPYYSGKLSPVCLVNPN